MSDLVADQNALIDTALKSFQNAMNNAGDMAWQDVEAELNSLSVDGNGHVNKSDHNDDVARDMNTAISDAADSSEYESGLEDLKEAIQIMADITKQHYADQDIYLREKGGYSYERMLKGLVTTMQNEVDIFLGQQAYAKEIMNPAYTAFYDDISKGKTKEATIKDMQHRIEDRFYNFSVTSSTTIMQQFTRRINEIFTLYGTEPLQWVAWEGPDDEITREFCKHYLDKSKYYHKEEVKQWVAEWGGEWGGMIPNTDQSSIFVNGGGFNCRHNFRYTTKMEVEENEPQAVARANNSGYY